MPRKDKKTGMTPQQELFCNLYASKEFFCSGVQAYMEAYGMDKSKKSSYNAARVNASKLLMKTNILRRIDSLIEDSGLNDSFVDKQLKKMVTQDADFNAKMAAIKEYNKLKSRITQKLDVTTNGKDLKSLTQQELLDIITK